MSGTPSSLPFPSSDELFAHPNVQCLNVLRSRLARAFSRDNSHVRYTRKPIFYEIQGEFFIVKKKEKVQNYCVMERMVLLKYLKIQLDINLKIILLNHQNNYVERQASC